MKKNFFMGHEGTLQIHRPTLSYTARLTAMGANTDGRSGITYVSTVLRIQSKRLLGVE